MNDFCFDCQENTSKIMKHLFNEYLPNTHSIVGTSKHFRKNNLITKIIF